jgi:hypothetical protein
MSARGATKPALHAASPLRESFARFRRGCAEPFHILRAILREPSARRYYLRVTLLQLGVVVLASAVIAFARFDDAPARPKAPRRPKTPAAAHASHGAHGAKKEEAFPSLPPLPPGPPAPWSSGVTPPAEAPPAGQSDPANVERIVTDALASAGVPADEQDEGDADDDDDDDAKDDDSAAPRPEAGNVGKGAATPHTFSERMAVYRRKLTLFLAELYGALLVVQWIVIALSRDYGDVITQRAAILVGGAPPENAPAVPRIRVNVPWLKKKLKRRLRGFMLFAIGIPCVWLLSFLTALTFEPFSHEVVAWVLHATNATLTFVWGAYWLSIFTGASTEVAWREEHTAPLPGFVRVWRLLVDRVRGFRWFLPRIYLDMLERASRSVTSPAAAFERRPAELLGLALARAVVAIPGVYLFLRPVFPLAAARIHLGATAPAKGSPDDRASAGPARPVAADGGALADDSTRVRVDGAGREADADVVSTVSGASSRAGSSSTT